MADTIATLVARLVADSSGFKAGLDSAQRDLSSFSSRARRESTAAAASFRAVGVAWTATAATLASVGIGVGLGNLVRSGAEFEQQINVIRATSGATGAQMRVLEGSIRRVGIEYRIGARAAASAAQELQKSGISIEDVNAGALDSAVTLARALGGDYADAASVAATAMQVFHEDASRLDEIVQGVTGTVLGGRFELGDYTLALQQGGEAAARAGLSIEDFNALLLLFQRNIGGSGSDMGTLARTLLSRLVPASGEAQARMRALGLSFFDARGQFVGLDAAANQIRASFLAMDDEARQRDFNLIFGIDASRGAGALMREGADGVAKYREEVVSAANASAIADARTMGFSGAVANLGAQFEELGVKIMQSGIGDLLTQLVNWAAGGASAVGAGLAAFDPDMSGYGVDPLIGRLAEEARRRGVDASSVNNNTGAYPAGFDPLAVLNPLSGVAYKRSFDAGLFIRDMNRRAAGDELGPILSEAVPDGGRFRTYRDTPLGQRYDAGLDRLGLGFALPPALQRAIDAARGPLAEPRAPSNPEVGAVGGAILTADEGEKLLRSALLGGEENETAGEFWQRLERDLAAARPDDLIGGADTMDAMLDDLARAFGSGEAAERMRRDAESFGKSLSGALESAFISNDWSNVGQALETGWRQMLWDVFLGQDVENMMREIATGVRAALDAVFGGVLGEPGSSGSAIGGALGNWIKSIFDGAAAGTSSGGGQSGGDGGFWSAIAQGVASLFGGGFAAGGTLAPGQWGIAGENGPEPIYGGSTGVTVYPASDHQGGGTTNVFHIDARGADAGVEQRIRIAVEQAAALGAQRGAAGVFRKVRAGTSM